jgi:hypothetical protein
MSEVALEQDLSAAKINVDDAAMKRAAKVCLVVSSFRNDKEIGGILHAVHALPEKIFDRIIVVDSLGTNAIPALIAEQGWTNVVYRSSEQNLGSAGNLAERLRLAAETDADFAYALNHDGVIDANAVRLLVERALLINRVGAAYPLHYLPSRNQYDLTGMQALPLPFRGSGGLPDAEYLDVHWCSSNGALYALEPVRQGLLPWADLWFGWEDVGYGWLLERHGFRQVIVTRALFADNYEYQPHKFLGRTIYQPAKPFWYAYYNARNMLLIARRNNRSVGIYFIIAVRILLEFAMTTVFRNHKLLRYNLLLRGILDGLQNKSGKGQYP